MSGFGRSISNFIFGVPAETSVAMSFRRFKTSSRGGSGFRSLNNSEISVATCGLTTTAACPAGVNDASPAATVSSSSDSLSNSFVGSDRVTTLHVIKD